MTGRAQLNDGGPRTTTQVLRLVVTLDMVELLVLMLLLMMIHLAAPPHNAGRVLVELHRRRRPGVQRVLGLQRILAIAIAPSHIVLVAVYDPIKIWSLLVQTPQIQLLLVLILSLVTQLILLVASTANLGQILLAATYEIHNRGALEAALQGVILAGKEMRIGLVVGIGTLAQAIAKARGGSCLG